MRFKLTSPLILIFFLLAPQLDAEQQEFPVLKGPYLGQKPPGTQPKVFGPGVISVDENFEHSSAVFSPRGDEVFWCTNVGMYTENGSQGMLRLYHMTMVGGTWTAPLPGVGVYSCVSWAGHCADESRQIPACFAGETADRASYS